MGWQDINVSIHLATLKQQGEELQMLLNEGLFLGLSFRLDTKKSSILILNFSDVYMSKSNFIVKLGCSDGGLNCQNLIQVIICDILMSTPFIGDRS